MKISRRQFIAGAALAGGLAAAGGMARRLFRTQRTQIKPNIIVFIADDMRFDAAGFAGNAIIRTPHMDKLATLSHVFDEHFVTTSICPTSRASIMTGQYALKHKVYDFHTHLSLESFNYSFPRLLKEHGYHTGIVGKWGMGGVQPKTEFDVWHAYENTAKYYPKNRMHITDLETKRALDFLKDRPADQPYLLIVSHKAPHNPFVPQERFRNLYADSNIPRAQTDTPELGSMLSSVLAGTQSRKNYAERLLEDRHYQHFMKSYYQLITGVDEAIGAILKQVISQGEEDRTAVIFTSDNGLMMGEHQLQGKWTMYEESIRTPLVIRPAPAFERIPPGRCKAMSLNIDIAPTILQMAGIDVPAQVQGRGLLPLMRDPRLPWRSGFYYQHPALPHDGIAASEGYRGERWKYSHYGVYGIKDESLFDIQSDPFEVSDLAALKEYQDIMHAMRAQTEEARQAILTA